MRMVLLRKSQVQMGETISVVIIIVILIVLGLVFYFSLSGSGVEREREEVQELDSISTAIFVSRMEEIKCSRAGATTYACIDMYKAKAFHNASSSGMPREIYTSLIGYANVTLNMHYSTQKNITIYSHEPSNISGSVTAYMPVMVSDPVNNTQHFAYLEVEVFS